MMTHCYFKLIHVQSSSRNDECFLQLFEPAVSLSPWAWQLKTV